jgi:DNA repair exonuclease SbcCD ATPase subunit
MSRAAVASTVLDQYSAVLSSKPLRQLAKAKLSPLKLQALYKELRDIDPLAGNGHVVAEGKVARAEQMCNYFQDHVQAASPVQKTVTLLETATNELAQSVSARAALVEEIDARSQLQKTMEQDITSLKALSAEAQKGEDASALETWEKSLAGKAAATVGASAGELKEAHAELKDLLDLTLQKRSAALDAQHAKLAQLQSAVKAADADLAVKKAHASKMQASMEVAQRKLSGITSSCDTTLNALAHRRHAGHMEAHAIEVTLKVLGGQ